MRDNFGRLVIDHIRGRYSLARAFWAHYVPVTALVLFVLGRSFTLAGTIERHPIVEMLALGFWIVLALAWIRALIGTFNAATRHLVRGGHPAWNTLAMAGIILTIVTPPFFPFLFGLVSSWLPALAAHVT